jgi:sodium-coupled neutral amino acid transporter 11
MDSVDEPLLPPVKTLNDSIAPGAPSKNNVFTTCLLFVSSMLGSGILNQPYVFKESGIIGAIGGMVVSIWLTWCSLNLLSEAGKKAGTKDFSGLAMSLYGLAGEQFVDWSILLSGSGSQFGYSLIVGRYNVALLT